MVLIRGVLRWASKEGNVANFGNNQHNPRHWERFRLLGFDDGRGVCPGAKAWPGSGGQYRYVSHGRPALDRCYFYLRLVARVLFRQHGLGSRVYGSALGQHRVRHGWPVISLLRLKAYPSITSLCTQTL